MLASVNINMKQFASVTETHYDMLLPLKPTSTKVLQASLRLSLSCVFLKEGKAT